MSPDRVIHFPPRDDDTSVVDDLTVRRWTRFGQDRSYVRTPGGSSIGYRDNRTGQVVVDDESFRAAVERTLAGTPVHVPDAHPGVCHDRDELDAEPDVAPPAGHDLAGTAAGSRTRARADSQRGAAPVRSVVSRVLSLRTDERSWRIGAAGEERVAQALDGLGPRWRCLHSVPVGSRGAGIDHLLLGPAGIFTLTARHHPDAVVEVDRDTVTVDDERVPYVRDARLEATRACRLLTAASVGPVPAVTGLVVVVGAHDGVRVARQPGDGRVRLVSERDLAPWLRRLPERLGDAAVVRLHNVARRADTWGDETAMPVRVPAPRTELEPGSVLTPARATRSRAPAAAASPAPPAARRS